MKFSTLQSAKKILIYGYGTEGHSSEFFLKKHSPSAEINVFDEAHQKASPDLNSFDVIIVSPGVNREKLGEIDSSKLTSNTEIFFENLPEEKRKNVIGISGTKGKSTTVKFCAEVIEHAGKRVKIGGNYGIPPLDVFDDFVNNKFDHIVAELSSYQLEHLKISPGVAIFLNIYPDHLDRHGKLEHYFMAKTNLWMHQTSSDFFITPEPIGMHLSMLKPPGRQILSQPMNAEFFPENSIFRAPHFLENFGTVATVCDVLKIKNKDLILKEVAQKFEGLPHRLEFFAEKNGIKFYDDAISTNPDSTLAAVNFLGEKLGSIVLGGQDRKQNFERLIKKCEQIKTHIIILESETKKQIENDIKKIGYKNYSCAKNMNEVVRTAFEKTESGKICLLSTAAPSYDNFKNYKEKGETFKKEVLAF